MFKKAFTLIELLIVISIIAILAAAIIPNFIGFDVEARVTATKSNLDTLRTRITLFRAKEGKYPDSLGELVTSYYLDAGVKKPYLTKMPTELISSKSGNANFVDIEKEDQPLTNEGGWAYYQSKAEVVVNSNDTLSSKWGEYAGQIPGSW